MTVLVVVLVVVAVAAVAGTIVAGRRLRTQRAVASAAEERARQDVADAAAANAAREAAEQSRNEAGEQARVAGEATVAALEATRRSEERAAAGEALAAASEARATAAEAEIEQARHDVDQAAQARRAAEHRAEAIERRAADAAVAAAAAIDDAPPAAGELDAQIVWALERSRTERTWRQSVAVGPTGQPILATAEDPLYEALQIELDAAREEVGAVVELDAELRPGLSAAANVLVLRAAQELLADVVRRSESTTLRVRVEGNDVVVTVEGEDEEGRPVLPGPLPLPPSAAIAPCANGVRLRNAAAPAPDP